MARNDSSDSEFDQDMERILREHFDSEGPVLSTPNDPWPWLESRMEEPPMTSFFPRLPRLLGRLNPMREGRLSPVFAVAGVAAVAVAVAAVVWAITGEAGTESPGGLAVVPATEAPAGAMPPTLSASATEAAPFTVARNEPGPQGSVGAAGPAGPSGADGATGPSGASAASAPTATPVAAAMASQVEVTKEMAVSVEESVESKEDMPESDNYMAMATQAPQATPAPTQAMAQPSAAVRGPQGSQGASEAKAPPPPQASFTGGTPSATNFRDYRRQPFVAASEDNVSTFSLDTDRTSFQLALNWARSGYEINPDSVRAEEWINAFNYEYDPPPNSDQFAISGDLFPHPLDEDKRLARIAFQAPELVGDKPVNVTLVLDASGSMADGNRVDIARQAAESIRQSLRAEDRIAVVHFTQDVIRRYTVEHTAPGDRDVRDSISWLEPHGSTNVQAGLNLGVELADAARDRRPDAYNYIILMSDGVANVDATDPFSILETAYDADTRNPLRLITIGVGIHNYNDQLLEQLAQHGNGWYRYLDNPEQARVTFSRENWLALSIPYADQTRAQVTWNTGTVERWRIVGYENRVTADENFTQDRKEFAELYSGAATTVLYELELTESAQSLASVPLGSVELRWVDPATGDSRSQTRTLSGRPGAGFEGQEGSLALFGAIVGLAADLYGALLSDPKGSYSEGAYPEVHSGLSSLLVQLRSLSGDLGALDAYNDFMLVLEHMTGDVEERLPPSTPSGYSR